MLTTVTTILGLVPMALQINMNFFTQTVSVGGITSIWWVQLSTAIIFGLAFSTMLTLVLIPSMLALPANTRGSWSGIVGRFRRKPKPEEQSSIPADRPADDRSEPDRKQTDNDDMPIAQPDAAE